MFKTLLAVTLVVLAAFFLAVSGGLFMVWPTTVDDRVVPITPERLGQLRALQEERKFLPDEAQFYPGAPDEAVRIAAQQRIDATIDQLLLELPRDPRRSVVLRSLKTMLPAFDRSDSEEQDRALFYCERILAIVGIDHSGGLLTVWRYGLPLGSLFTT